MENSRTPSAYLFDLCENEGRTLSELKGGSPDQWRKKIRALTGPAKEIIGKTTDANAFAKVRIAVGTAISELLTSENRGEKPGMVFEKIERLPGRTPVSNSFISKERDRQVPRQIEGRRKIARDIW